uniref:Secreted protein n=1 Tax=Ascaris lumbricoides TaxID=6252 RepID=A0A0M3ICZ7_ASCLU
LRTILPSLTSPCALTLSHFRTVLRLRLTRLTNRYHSRLTIDVHHFHHEEESVDDLLLFTNNQRQHLE